MRTYEPPAGCFERVVDRLLQGLEHRRHAEYQSCHKCHRNRKQQDAHIQTCLPHPWDGICVRRDNKAHSRPRERDAEQSAGSGKHQSLDRELPHKLRAASADCLAHTNLASAGIRPRQQKVSDIDTGNQKEERNSTEQHQHRGLDLADHFVLKAVNRQRMIFRTDGMIAGGIRLPEFAFDSMEILRRAQRSYARLQMRQEREIMAPCLLQLLSGNLQRRPRVHGFREARWEFEAVSHHADDLRLTSVEQNLAPDNVRVAAEGTHPKSMTEHEGGLGSRIVVGGQNWPAHLRSHSKHRHHTAAQIADIHSQGPVASLKAGASRRPCFDLIPRAVEALHVAEFRR